MKTADAKRKIFIAQIAGGATGRAAAIAAGYAAHSATAAASRMLARHDVQAAIVESRRANAEASGAVAPTDPLDYMLSVMADVAADPRLRIDAAKALMPYFHAHKGAAGKKAAAATAAEKVATGRFARKVIPFAKPPDQPAPT